MTIIQKIKSGKKGQTLFNITDRENNFEFVFSFENGKCVTHSYYTLDKQKSIGIDQLWEYINQVELINNIVQTLDYDFFDDFPTWYQQNKYQTIFEHYEENDQKDVYGIHMEHNEDDVQEDLICGAGEFQYKPSQEVWNEIKYFYR